MVAITNPDALLTGLQAHHDSTGKLYFTPNVNLPDLAEKCNRIVAINSTFALHRNSVTQAIDGVTKIADADAQNATAINKNQHNLNHGKQHPPKPLTVNRAAGIPPTVIAQPSPAAISALTSSAPAYGYSGPGYTRHHHNGRDIYESDTSEYSGGDDFPGLTEEQSEGLAEGLQETVGKIPYAWGGGHGAEPGATYGISDGGGYADECGDYNKVGMDCSGLVRYLNYKMTGEDPGPISTYSIQNSSNWVRIDPEHIRPGDAIEPTACGGEHVQTYIGDGRVCEALQSGTKIMISPAPTDFEAYRFVGLR